MITSAPIKLVPRGTEPNIDGEDCCSPPPVHIKTEEVAANARLLAALADPTRLGIVTMLSGLDEPLCVCQIVTQFDLGQPTISHHLRVLREARLVDCEKRGLWVYYWLNRDVLSSITTYLTILQKAASASLAL
jgi:ArsR family transcriptional regulator, arsenate/arsenite/antimonite-responsive transcriptional repressor